MAEFSMGMPGVGAQDSIYARLGGMPFFVQLVEHFYVHVAEDQALLAHYPEPDDLGPARERLHLFLAQYFGGPRTYTETRGHPRLRMRHLPFVIDADARDRWLAAMDRALTEMHPPEEVRAQMWEYFTMAAEAMRNTD